MARGSCSGLDRVFRDVRFEELGGLRVEDRWSTGRDAEVSHSLLHVTTVLSHSRNHFLTCSDVTAKT